MSSDPRRSAREDRPAWLASVALPSAEPSPPEERARLEAAWRPPSGWRLLSAVNNTYIGLFYIAAALLFFVLAGVLALAMRIQLAFPENDFLGQDRYNQFFTMHGTVMMFLFAVPAVEAMGVYLLPNMLAARDLPFPRLGAYAFWAYFAGGLAFFASLFFGVAPDGGWFMYPPLTSHAYSPGVGADFWLLGIGFIEISAIAGAIEIVVGVLRTRAPGMSLSQLPIYAWAMLVFAGMIVFGFPAVILATALLELERAFHWPFFVAAQGGDPLLWQHLFWFFGHPEVYIIFVPAAGFVSMILPTMVRARLIGYRLVVLGLIATGFTSLGVWVHHMFTTGIPGLSVGFFSAASMAVAVPSAIQVFAWIATLAAGRMRAAVPSLFMLGFLFIFTLGGLTGVMLAVVPFDWQAHDTYFVVGHFHYVLIGGMVFPLFGAIYYWIPTASRQALSERVGRWVFGLMFVGFNVAFFPMHVTGLLGMPRRVWTYPEEMGWGWLNLTSTLGAFTLAAGALLFLFDLARRFRFSMEDAAGNVWRAGTLEWLPNSSYGVRSIPIVTSREPLWDEPALEADVGEGRYFLPGTRTGGRETLVTSALEARPQYVLQLPGPSWAAPLAALFTALFFLLLTVKLVLAAMACGVVAAAAILVWLWDTDRGPAHPPVEVGGALVLPVYQTGSRSHSWWAMVTLLLVAASIFAALVFSYFFLWLGSPEVWPAAGAAPRSALAWPLASAALLAASGGAIAVAGRALARSGSRARLATRLALAVAIPLLAMAIACELRGHWLSGLRPTQSSYGAVVYTFAALQGLLVAVAVVMGLYTLARSLCGRLGPERRATFDNTRLFWHYTVGQGLASLLLVHAAARGLP